MAFPKPIDSHLTHDPEEHTAEIVAIRSQYLTRTVASTLIQPIANGDISANQLQQLDSLFLGLEGDRLVVGENLFAV